MAMMISSVEILSLSQFKWQPAVGLEIKADVFSQCKQRHWQAFYDCFEVLTSRTFVELIVAHETSTIGWLWDTRIIAKIFANHFCIGHESVLCGHWGVLLGALHFLVRWRQGGNGSWLSNSRPPKRSHCVISFPSEKWMNVLNLTHWVHCCTLLRQCRHFHPVRRGSLRLADSHASDSDCIFQIQQRNVLEHTRSTWGSISRRGSVLKYNDSSSWCCLGHIKCFNNESITLNHPPRRSYMHGVVVCRDSLSWNT